MALERGAEIEVDVEKPAAGGRMIARPGGQVVLVRGAIPGERVVVRVERVEKRLAFAETVRVVVASTDRRDAGLDPLCGGSAFAHIAYPRQLTLKGEIVADAFARLGRLPLEAAVAVAASPERGYRMRARFHVRDGRLGFYREGTHELCDASATGQVLPETLASAVEALAVAESVHGAIAAVEVSENVAASERGLLIERAGGGTVTAGDPSVGDPLSVLTGGRAAAGVLRRRPASFFQGNRYLIATLVTSVLDAVPADGPVLDLYAGVGLFSIALAAAGRPQVTAVEGHRGAGADLRANASGFTGVTPIVDAVEAWLSRARRGPDGETVVLDPPRTGLSADALQLVVGRGAARIVYVSCDPATLARDARRLVDAGYRLLSLSAFDLFPNTPHVESLAVFAR